MKDKEITLRYFVYRYYFLFSKMKKQKKPILFDADYLKVSHQITKENQPFLNVFSYEEENVDKQRNGRLFGIIQSTDLSDDSSYLPNLIAQIIKKEFFRNSKRSFETRFEVALKKANMALSDLAENEIIQWIGKLHTAIGVLKENEFIFTYTGKGKILLIRDKKILNLTPSLKEETETDSIHPLKTFVDVSHGYLQDKDKLIFMSSSVSKIFSQQDLERHAKTFFSAELDNLIKSTIENEGENEGIIIVNLKKHLSLKKSKLTKKAKSGNKNFFGADTAKKKEPKKTKPSTSKKKQAVKKKSTISYSPSPFKESEAPLDDKTTPSLSDNSSKNQSSLKDNSLSPFEKSPELYISEEESGQLEKEIKKKKIWQLKKIKKKIFSIFKKSKTGLITATQKTVTSGGKLKTNILNQTKKQSLAVMKTVAQTKTKIAQQGKHLLSNTKNLSAGKFSRKKSLNKNKKIIAKNSVKNEIVENNSIKLVNKKSSEKKSLDFPMHKLKKLTAHTDTSLKKSAFEDIPDKVKAREGKKINKKFKQFWDKPKKIKVQAIDSSPKKINDFSVPFLKKITALSDHPLGRLLKENLFVVIVALLIVGIPFTLWMIIPQFKKQTSPTINSPVPLANKKKTPPPKKETITPTRSKSKKLVRLNKLPLTLSTGKESLFVLAQDETFYALDPTNNKTETFHSEKLKGITHLTYLPSLNLFFFLPNKTTATLVSFSPATKKFDTQKINLPDKFELVGAGTFLDYLYLLDKNSHQIYRYPRAEGGFGEAKAWLKKPLENKNPQAIAIDENIRLAYANGKVEKYYRGKLVNEKTFSDFLPAKIFTTDQLKNYYLLDTAQGKLLQVDKERDEIKKELVDVNLKNTLDFQVDEKNNQIYFIGKDNQILKLAL